MFIHSHTETLQKCCLSSTAVLHETGIDTVYIFNKTFRLMFLVHHRSILRNTVAWWFGELDSDPHPQQLDHYTFQFSPPRCHHTLSLS